MKAEGLKVLIIEDSKADFLLTERYLSEHMPEARCRMVSSRPELETALKGEDLDVVLSDYNVPGMDFLENNDLIRSLRPDLPVILVSGSIGEERAVELIKQGVWDFVIKDNMLRLASAISRGLQEAEDRRARQKAEEAQQASDNKYRILFESIPQIVFTKDIDSIYLTCNRNYARDLGIQPEEIAGHTDYDFFPKDLADKYHADDRRIMESGIQESIEERYVRSGHEAWIQAIKTPIRDEGGKVGGIIGIAWDITERRLAAQKLQEQAALLDITVDAIFVRDMRHDIIYWNKGAEKTYGWSSVEAIGKNADNLLGAHASDSKNAYQVVLEKGEWLGEFQRTSRDGRELTIQARWTLVRDPAGAPRGILAVNTDVTEQRMIQQQLLRVQRLESLGTLAGGIAHDLNNILSPILMGAEVLSLQFPEGGSRKIMETMKTAALRGAGIVRQVLSFARGISGEHSEVQLKHVIREVEDLLRETFPKSIDIRSQIPKNLLPAVGDATQLHQVLMNLCVNARDAMPEGGTLTLSAENVELDEAYARMHIEARPIRYVALKVEDTGTGMAPGVIEKIFDPFFTTKGPDKGTGLGLSTAHSIAKSHRGFINVYSEVGKGTAFKVYIPAADKGEVDQAEKVQEGIPMGQGELIIVADDEAAVREITKQILESYGYQVLLAKDGTEAVVHYAKRKEEIKVILTDMAMPFMDGPATIRALRKIDPGVKIIGASGLVGNGQANEVAGLNVNAFLAKPYTAETLLRTLRDVLETEQRFSEV
jgi:PAS domain S-box-containing protein